jgi:hypothetical protein
MAEHHAFVATASGEAMPARKVELARRYLRLELLPPGLPGLGHDIVAIHSQDVERIQD